MMKLQIHNSNLIQNLGSAFISPEKTLTELVQNGRRAGATRIDIDTQQIDAQTIDLTVTDNGSGIDDFQNIFTVAKSGWDDSIAQSENPYGMGALSVLYYSPTVEIKSLGFSQTVNTKSAIDGLEFGDPVKCDDAPEQGTSVRVQLKLQKQDIAAHFLASSIPIYLDGELIAATFSQAHLSCKPETRPYETELGTLLVVGNPVNKSGIYVVLQDMVISDNRTLRYPDTDFIVLYCNNKVRANMPARDTLLNDAETRKTILELSTRALVSQIVAYRKEHGDKETLNKYFSTIKEFAPELLNDFDMLPVSCFNFASGSVRYGFSNSHLLHGNDVITKAECQEMFITSSVDVMGDLEHEGDSSALQQFLVAAKAHSVDSSTLRKLPQDHWLLDMVIDIHSMNLTIQIDGIESMGSWGHAHTESYEIYLAASITARDSITGLKVELSSFWKDPEGINYKLQTDLQLNDDSGCIVLSKARDDSAYDAINATVDSRGEYDDYADAAFLDDCCYQLTQFVDFKVNNDACKLLTQALNTLPAAVIKAISGRSLVVSGTGAGFTVTEQEAA